MHRTAVSLPFHSIQCPPAGQQFPKPFTSPCHKPTSGSFTPQGLDSRKPGSQQGLNTTATESQKWIYPPDRDVGDTKLGITAWGEVNDPHWQERPTASGLSRFWVQICGIWISSSVPRPRAWVLIDSPDCHTGHENSKSLWKRILRNHIRIGSGMKFKICYLLERKRISHLALQPAVANPPSELTSKSYSVKRCVAFDSWLIPGLSGDRLIVGFVACGTVSDGFRASPTTSLCAVHFS